MPKILVAEDNVKMARLLADQLGDAGFEVVTAGGGEEAIAHIKRQPFDLVITDLRMEAVDGFDVLRAARAADESMPVIMMTAFGAVESAVEAMRAGAFHYLTKPFKLDELMLFVERALAERRLRDEHRALQRLAADRSSFANVVGRSASMLRMFDSIERVAQSQATVLIRGESGSGKELVARAIHFAGARRERPFVAVNCTALPEQLLESELFGHVRGAFTGATSMRRGLFVEADGGTLFLDEIGDMPPELQTKLLRALEDGEVRPVGADAPRRVDVRLLAATHQDLEARVAEGKFRADLFYRLNVVQVPIPPLRQRAEDIPLLVEHFLARSRARNPASKVRAFAPEVIQALTRFAWPGNVRELENLVERLVIMAPGEVVQRGDVEDQASHVMGGSSPIDRARAEMVPLRQLENEYIAWVVERCGGNKPKAAEILGIDLSTIYRRERGSQ